jgi:hypothetical protein
MVNGSGGQGCCRGSAGTAGRPNAALIGTPILAENAMGHRTTATLFDECLHRYVITDAIWDENVLRFSVEYWGLLRRPDGTEVSDEEVAGIELREVFESEARLGNVVDWIAEHHGREMHDRASRGGRYSARCLGSKATQVHARSRAASRRGRRGGPRRSEELPDPWTGSGGIRAALRVSWSGCVVVVRVR